MPRSVLCILALLAWQCMLAQLPALTFRNVDIWPVASEGNTAWDILEDPYGFLWIGTSMALYRYDGQHLSAYLSSQDTTTINGNNITTLHLDADSIMWVGTTDGGLNRYRYDLDQFERCVPPDGVMGSIRTMIDDGHDHKWIGAKNGLFHYDTKNATYLRLVPQGKPRDPRGYDFRALLQDPFDQDVLWVGGLGGLYRFDIADSSFDYYPMPWGLDGHSNYMIMDLQMPVNGKLWIATWGGGMLSYDLSAHIWRRYLPDDPGDSRWQGVMYKCLPEGPDALWVASSNGFGMFNTDAGTYAFYNWDTHDLTTIDSSFAYTRVMRTAAQTLVVTRVNGFSIASLPGKEHQAMPYQPCITAIQIDGKPIFSEQAVHFIEDISLGVEEKDASFTMSTPGYYGNPAILSFMLEGYDKDWQILQAGYTARYTNLPAGDRTFRYRASIDGKDWTEGKAIHIEKAVFFWQTTWFVAGCVVVAILILFTIYRIQVRNMKRELSIQSEFDKKVAELELKALRSQMNPHFMFNSLNSIKHYILTNEPLKASEYLTNFATLIRSTLHNSAEKLIPLKSELDTLLLYIELEQLRFREKFNFTCTIEEGIDTENTWVPPLILQPFVENAIWHGLMHKTDPGTLSIMINKQNGFVLCAIEDDGVGRQRAQEFKSKTATGYKSMGIGITRNRIDIHNKINELGIQVTIEDKQDVNGNGTGTRVTVAIPAQLASNAET